jgi:hypothetical protein
VKTFASRAAIVVTLVWLASLLLWFTPGIARPDGAGYFVYLPSTWFDRDLLFFDEWQRLGLIRNGTIQFKSVTPTDHLGNHWTVGTATAWLPAYAFGDAVAVAMDRQREGFALPYSVPVLVVSALAGLATLLASIHVARELRLRALAAALAIWFGSPLLWYSLRHGSMAHAMSAAAGAAIVLTALRLRDEVTPERLIAVGMAVGFAVAVRPQNAPLALLPFFLLDGRRNLRLLRGALWVALGGVIGVLPQLVVSQVLNGSPLAFVNVGGAAHQWQMFERVRVWQPMLSWFHGLVPWTPILALAVIGLIPLAKVDRGLAFAGAWAFGSQWLMVALLDRSFWGGVSFGQRRFDSCTFFFVLGLAALFARLPAWVAAVLATLGSLWTMALLFATPRFDLNVYQPPAALLDAVRSSFFDPRWYAILGSTPQAHRTSLLLVIGVTLVAAILAILVVLQVPAPPRTALAGAYLIAVAGFLAWCGSNDAARLAEWRPVIERNRGGRGEMMNILYNGLMREADYLRRSGQHAEALAVEAEAEALEGRISR